MLPEILAAAPGASAIVFADDAPETALSVLQLGASGVLSQYADPSEIVRAIAAVMAGEVWAQGQPTGRLVHELLHRAHQGQREARLTTREREVLHLIGQGKRNREIAAALSVEVTTVKTHTQHLMEKLEVHDRILLALYARAISMESSDQGEE